MSDDVVLTIGGRDLSGWTAIRVTRDVERCPSDFDLDMTELYPGEADALVVQPGDTCELSIGYDVVITGYVDRFIPSIAGNRHSIRITGRSKCADLVDCAAEWPSGQISGSNVLGIAQRLANPYGITVATDTNVGGTIPQFNIMLGETPYEIIERICRYRALLAYDRPDGSLFLTRVSTDSAACGFEQGVNIESASITYSMDERFSEYYAYLQSMDVLSDMGGGGNLLAKVYDEGVPRHRRRVIIAEAGGGGLNVAIQRAKWESARRLGRSMELELTTDNWRDSDGNLWTPNTLVPLSIPALKIDNKTWLVGSVTYRLDENGTHADLRIMPPDAFNPEPILLQPFPPDVPAGIGAP